MIMRIARIRKKYYSKILYWRNSRYEKNDH